MLTLVLAYLYEPQQRMLPVSTVTTQVPYQPAATMVTPPEFGTSTGDGTVENELNPVEYPSWLYLHHEQHRETLAIT